MNYEVIHSRRNTLSARGADFIQSKKRGLSNQGDQAREKDPDRSSCLQGLGDLSPDFSISNEVGVDETPLIRPLRSLWIQHLVVQERGILNIA